VVDAVNLMVGAVVQETNVVMVLALLAVYVELQRLAIINNVINNA
jgi:hypothetical protein